MRSVYLGLWLAVILICARVSADVRADDFIHDIKCGGRLYQRTLLHVALPPKSVAPGITMVLNTRERWDAIGPQAQNAVPTDWWAKQGVVIGPRDEPISCEAFEIQTERGGIVVRMLRPTESQPIAVGGCVFLGGDTPIALVGYWERGF